MSKELEALDVIMTALAQNMLLAENDKGYILRMPRVKREREELCKTFDYGLIEQALQRLDKYEQILGSGRLTDRNYKNTTLDLDSCKPYVRLGQLEDIYEEGKKNE